MLMQMCMITLKLSQTKLTNFYTIVAQKNLCQMSFRERYAFHQKLRFFRTLWPSFHSDITFILDMSTWSKDGAGDQSSHTARSTDPFLHIFKQKISTSKGRWPEIFDLRDFFFEPPYAVPLQTFYKF